MMNLGPTGKKRNHTIGSNRMSINIHRQSQLEPTTLPMSKLFTGTVMVTSGSNKRITAPSTDTMSATAIKTVGIGIKPDDKCGLKAPLLRTTKAAAPGMLGAFQS